MIKSLIKNWRIDRKNLSSDFLSALTLGISSIPDSMASAILAGINPLTGLYTMIIATPIGALFTSSVFMHISTTSALSLAVGSSLAGYSGDEKLQMVFVLALMVGVIQITLGLLKMGFLVRFVPYSVMTGFLNGVAVLIILGQLEDFTGYRSAFSNRVIRAFDTLLNINQIVLPTLVVGLVTIGLIVLFGRIKKLEKFSLILPMVIASVIAALPAFSRVILVGDVTDVPNALPAFHIPQLNLIIPLIIPAFALSIIGLVQGAGISQGYPNPGGKFPDPSGDFFGQGMANLATSFFQGMPSGGSLSGTALVVQAGAKSRWANFLVGVLIAVIILLFAGLVKLIAMPALAGLLIVIGFRTINPSAVMKVWNTGMVPRVVMLITFVGTLIMPLQFAVLLGVAISILLLVIHQANRIKVVELVPGKNGFPTEHPAPKKLPSHKVTVLQPYGSLFYAAAKTFEENLPAADKAIEAVVIFVLRGYDDFGSTMIGVMDRYVQTIMQNGGIVKLAGVSEAVLAQLERTGLVALLGRENIYVAQRQWGAAAIKAYEDGQAWLEKSDRAREKGLPEKG